jgi:hypothetical protein
MIIHNALDKIAEISIPEGIHEELYVNSRKAWIACVEYMIEAGLIKPSSRNIAALAENWEMVLYSKYSTLN